MIVIVIVLVFASSAIAQIQAFTQGPDDAVWAARADHLMRIGAKPEVVTWYRGSGEVHSILADQNGSDLWVGTENGLVRCNISGRQCDPDARIPAAPVIELGRAGDSLWIATREKLYQIKNSTVTSAALPSNRIDAMAVTREEVVWVGMRSSVQTFRNGSFQEVLKTSAQAITFDRGTGVVWIGAGHELVRHENGKLETFSLPAPPPNVRMRPPITSILATQSGKVYVGTHGGLLQLSGNTFRKILEEEIFALFEDGKGTLWIGTSEGLKKRIGGKISDVPLPE